MKIGFFFDMDGTLYNTEYHEVSHKTFMALHQLQEQRHLVCLATSRAIRELDNLPRDMYDFDFYYRIIDGGALILNRKNEVVDKGAVPKDVMNNIVSYCRENDMTLRYSTVDGNYWEQTPLMFEHKFIHYLYLNTPLVKAYDEDEALNLLVYIHNEKQKQDILDIANGCGIVQYPDCLEIRANNRDKSLAIQDIINKEKLDKVYCFGDGPNDQDMLKLADVGVCMGNGCKECKEIADVIIKNVDEDAIYYYLVENNLCKEVD